jgi:hypothetical protein
MIKILLQYKNDLLLPLTALIIGVSAIILLKMMFNNVKSVKTKLFEIDTKKNGQKVEINERRNNDVYKYYVEKILDCQIEINKLHEILRQKQTDVFNSNFIYITNTIIEAYVKGYFTWCNETGKPYPKNFESTTQYFKYSLIMKSISEENIINVHSYVKENDLWRYNSEEWIKYKKRSEKKHMELARDKFQQMYNENICNIPKVWHNINIMRHTESKIKVIIDNMQEELRQNSNAYHLREVEVNQKMNCYKEFRECQNANVDQN